MDFNAVLARLKAETGIKTQAALAKVLDVRPATITEAKKRDSIPADWLIKLSRHFGLNPLWLADGAGPKYIEKITAYPKGSQEFDDGSFPDEQDYYECDNEGDELSPDEFWTHFQGIIADPVWRGWYQIELMKRFPELVESIKKRRAEASKDIPERVEAVGE